MYAALFSANNLRMLVSACVLLIRGCWRVWVCLRPTSSRVYFFLFTSGRASPRADGLRLDMLTYYVVCQESTACRCTASHALTIVDVC